MHRSVATVSLSGTLEEKLPAIAGAGFDGVEIFENDLVISAWTPAQVRGRAADLGLSIDLYQPFRDFEAVPAEQFARNLRRAERKFDVMEQLGARLLLVCSNVSPGAIDDDALAAAQLHALAEAAAARGLQVAYEALAWGRHVDDYRHAWRIVEAADHDHLGVCLDSFHVLSRDVATEEIRDIPGHKIFFLQLADAPQLVMDVLQWSRHYRCFPGQGGFDLPGFLTHVLAAGYDGPLSLEVFNDVFRQADTGRTAIDALRSLLVLEEEVRRAAEAAGPAAGSLLAGRELCTPPAPVEPTEHAFAEVAVDERAAPGVERVLSAMGFGLAGKHLSKPVQLWEQGGARVLVNRGDRRLGPRLAGNPAITALAVETADPPRSARRAEQLLAPVLPRERGPAEADLSAVAAPDGTSIFFCRSRGSGEGAWLGDFARTTPLAADRPAPRELTRIDHVGLSQPFDHFDEAALFYRAVLGLSPEDSVELAGPDGLVRSRAMSSRAGGGVRIALSVSLLGRGGGARQQVEPQHVAFSTADIFAAAAAWSRRGAMLLAIPANYYADLEARFELPRDLLERMQEFGVLYDRSMDGEYFHVCTPLLGDRLFFEVVQRAAGYDGYGASNVPVRLAAQRAAAQRAADPTY